MGITYQCVNYATVKNGKIAYMEVHDCTVNKGV